MNKIIVIIVLAIISITSWSYIIFDNIKDESIMPEVAKVKAEKFINDTLLQAGVTAVIGDVSEESGLYQLPLTLPDGTELNSYISKDGKFFFPEGLDMEELTKQLADIALNNNNNNQNQMELKTEILSEGSGEQVVKSGDAVTVDYTGTLEDGTQFDSSIGRAPFEFTVGQGRVIAGWEQGLIGMKINEERKLTIPSHLGYGASGSGSIPANATLIFTIKLIAIN